MFRPGFRARRVLLIAASAVLGLMLAWVGGFVWFARQTFMVPPPPPHADGIVVLTGGADRIEAGLHLLTEGVASRLLVSGTGGGANLSDLARRAGIPPGPLAGRVTLGRGAATTHGNAAETASWARQLGMHSLIVVTATYHMPRALIEIGRALPGVRLYAAPVLPAGILGSGGWPTGSGLRLLVGEWNKYLVARLGLTALEATPPPLRPAPGSGGHIRG